MKLKHPNKAIKVHTSEPEGYRGSYRFVFSDKIEGWYTGHGDKYNGRQRDYSRRKKHLWNNYKGLQAPG